MQGAPFQRGKLPHCGRCWWAGSQLPARELSLPQNLRFRNQNSNVFCKGIRFLGIALLEKITMALAPFPVALRECVEALLPYTVHMPEGMDKVNSFLRSVVSGRTVEAFADFREGVFQESNQVVRRGCPLLRSKLKLTVQCFQIITNGIYGV